MRPEPAESELPGPRPIDRKGVVITEVWCCAGRSVAATSAVLLGHALLAGEAPAGPRQQRQEDPGGHQLHPSQPLALDERRICANSDGDDVVVPSRMTESGLPQ
jgi:hypothetical protein